MYVLCNARLWRLGNGEDEFTDITTPLPGPPDGQSVWRDIKSIWASPTQDLIYAVAVDRSLWQLDLDQRAWRYVTDMPYRFGIPGPEELQPA